MPLNLPTDLLRSFAAIVDSGSMLKASERVFVTQSAISLQMKRLEDLVQAQLFHRDGRKLALTPAGDELLTHAREILALNDRAVAVLTGGGLVGPARIGLVQDFADTLLSGVLSQFARLNPETQLQVRVGGSQELLDLLEADRLDVVLCMGAEDDAAAVRVADMDWLGDEMLLKEEALPLAILEEPCRFRDAALAALQKAGRSYRVVLETPSSSVLRVAVESGLAVTCRTAILSNRRIEEGLPTLPRVAYVRHMTAKLHPTLKRLADLVEAALVEL